MVRRKKNTASVSALFIWVNSAAGLAGQINSGIKLDNNIPLFIIVVTIGAIFGGYWGSKSLSFINLEKVLLLVLLAAAIKLIFLNESRDKIFGQLIEIVGSNTYELEITKLEYDAILTQLNKQMPSIKSFTIQLAQNNKIIQGETELDLSPYRCISTIFRRMNKIKRYLRQITLDEIGVKGQNRLLQSRVLLIGAGGLGCPLVQILASSGIGHISVLDYDRVAIHNLARQIIFKKEDVGRYKAEVISKYINDYYPDCSINHYNIFLIQIMLIG